MKFINSKTIFFLLALIILVIPSVFPLLKTGFIVTDDGGWMIIRLSAFYDTIRDGQIPARFIERLNFGYGYPVANFLYPGYLYLGSLVHLAGFNFIDSVKILFGASLFLSAIFSFIWLKRLFGNLDALVGSLVYLYSPYHLFDIYKRGSLGEALSISILPLGFLGIEKGSTVLIGIAVFFLLLFHNTLAVFFLPLIPIYAILRKSFLRSLPGIVLGAAASSFFTIPAIFELRYTKFLDTAVSNPSEYFADIFLVGIVSVLLFVSASMLSFLIYRENLSKIPYRNLLIFFSFVFLVSVFLSTQTSNFLWTSIGASFVQFPYRFLSLVLISSAFLGALVSYMLFGKLKLVFGIAVILILGVFSFGYITEVKYENYPDEYYSTNDATTTVHDEYMPIWVGKKPTARPSNKVEVVSGDTVVLNVNAVSNRVEINTTVNSDSRIRLNTIYYPGWEAFIDGEKKEILYDNEQGVMELELKQYDNKVTFIFRDDLVRTLSNTISILAVLLLVYYISRPLLKF